MKRLFLSLLPLVFLFSNVHAQDTTKTFQHEIGVDVSFFLKTFFSFNDQIIVQSPFEVGYKLIYKKVAFRAGVSAFFGKFENGDTLQAFDFNERFLVLRLGAEGREELGDRWLMLYGADILLERNKSESHSSNPFQDVTNKQQTKGIGIAPFLGIEFKLTKRLSLMTHTSFTYLDENFISETTFKMNPSANTKEEDKQSSGMFQLPSFIVLLVRL